MRSCSRRSFSRPFGKFARRPISESTIRLFSSCVRRIALRMSCRISALARFLYAERGVDGAGGKRPPNESSPGRFAPFRVKWTASSPSAPCDRVVPTLTTPSWRGNPVENPLRVMPRSILSESLSRRVRILPQSGQNFPTSSAGVDAGLWGGTWACAPLGGDEGYGDGGG